MLNNKDNILKRLLKYKYVILLTDDIYNLDMKKQEIAQFQKFRILEFTAKLRKKLIQKWSDIYDETESANLRYKKNDEREETINSTIGKVFNNGIMPAYPFFILSVLISNEILGNLDPNITSQGHCYQALIYISLRKIGIREKEIDMYLNFLTELSYHIFKENIFELCSQDMEEFLEKYNNNFNMSVDSSKIIENLLKSKILIKTSFGSIKFLYPYLYYYFIGKYLSEHYLEEEKTINKIVNLSKENELILFTDPDYAGKKIRDTLKKYIPNIKHAFISRKDATKNKNVGVENANDKAILDALKNLITEKNENNGYTFTMQDLIENELCSGKNAKERRIELGDYLKIGYYNSKQLLNALNSFSITKEQFDSALKKLK